MTSKDVVVVDLPRPALTADGHHCDRVTIELVPGDKAHLWADSVATGDTPLVIAWVPGEALDELGDEQVDSRQFQSWAEVEDDLKQNRGAVAVIPLYMLDHSGVFIHAYRYRGPYAGWDSGQLGFIWVDAQRVRDWFGVKRLSPKTLEQAKLMLLAEVKEYSAYVSGDCWGYEVYCPVCAEVAQPTVWGYSGDFDETTVEAEVEALAASHQHREGLNMLREAKSWEQAPPKKNLAAR